MSAILRRAQRATLLLVVALLGLSLAGPLMSLAQASFTAGDTAVISAGGGSVNVRADADPAAESLAQIPDGTEVYILDGPYTAADGSLWYHAGVWDLTGYINASMLGSVPSTVDTAAETEAAVAPETSSPSTIPWKQPIDFGVVVDNSASPLPADGLACRTDASGSASTIVRMWLGQTVEVVGQPVWTEGVEFLPINCQGVGGFVKADYIALQSQQVAATEEPATEDAISTEEVVAADPDAPVAGDLIVTVQDQSGAIVPGGCFTLYLGGERIADSCDSSDSIPNNGNSGFFAVPEGTYSLVSTSFAANNQEVWIGAGDTAYATVNVTVEDAAVTEEVVTEEVVTEEVATEDVVTEEVVTEEVVETEVPATEIPVTEEVATETVTEVPTDVATEVPVTEEPTDVATEVPVTEVPTELPTETVVPTDEPVTEEATEVATEAPGSTLGEPIGDATVTGTNGEGIRCRVAPDAAAATITTLTEGTTVFVYAEPVNGYLAIGCGNQLGYGDVNYLWSGGAGDEIPASASSVVVVGTGGMMLNCRAGAGTSFGVVATVAQGTVLTSRGASTNGWAPVVCGGKNGFVSIAYVEASGQTPAPGTGTGETPAVGGQAGTGTVTGTGSSLRCRTSANTSGAIITSLPDGTVVTTRGAASNGWVPVVCAGQNGFVSAEFLTLGAGSGTVTTPTATATATPGTGSGTTGAYVKVTGTGGASLNCRSAASMSGMVITAIPFGSTVATRGAASNGWVPVTCGGKAGYVSASYVTATTNPGGGTTDPGTNPGTGNNGGASGTAVVNAGGTGLRCRSAANTTAPIITTVADGSTVSTRGASSNGWTPVVCGGQNGFMASEFLSSGGSGTGTTPTPSPTPTQTPGTGSGLVTGDRGKLNGNANMRYQASASASLVVVVPAGEVLLVTGNGSNGYTPVDYDGLKGFVLTSLLTETSEALSQRGGSGNEPTPQPNPGGGGSTATGNAIVNYAMRYVGYPYVWATAGPSSFDCSGYTNWVIKNVVGPDIGRGLWTQVVAGTPVSRENLQPGDLVFFQNTYKPGLSHSGIYIGNNQFVHAENENTGVRVSDINSNYYGSRWYGAVRIG